MADKIDLGKIGYDVYIDDRQYARGLKKLEKDAEKTAGNIGGIFAKLGSLIAVGMLFRAGWREAKSFSKELANVKSIADDLSKSQLRKELLKLNPILGNSAELTNALYFAYSAGVRGSEKELAQFTGQVAALAKTIGAGVTPAMDAITTMMNAYGLSVHEAGMLTDWFYQIVKSGKTTGPELAQSLGQIAATAASSGISIKELGAALATLTTTMPTNIAVTSLAASIRALMNPTDETRKIARELGIEMSMAAIKAKGFGGVMQDIFNKTQGRGDLIGQLFPAESSRAVMALAGTQLNTLLTNIEDFGKNGGAAMKGFTEAIDNLDDQMAMLTNTGKKLLEMIVSVLIRVITLNGLLFDMFRGIGDINSSTLETIAKLITLIGSLVLVKKLMTSVSISNRTFSAGLLKASRATGLASKANYILAGSFKALWKSMMANPLAVVITGLTLAVTAIEAIIGSNREQAEKEAESVDIAVRSAEKLQQTGNKQRQADIERINRLKQLEAANELNADQMKEADGIISSLNGQYGNIGVTIDKATGKIVAQAGAWDKLKDKMTETAKAESRAIIMARLREIKVIEAQYKQKFSGLFYKHDIRGFTDKELQRGLQGTLFDANQKEMIAKLLDAREAYRVEYKKYQDIINGNITGETNQAFTPTSPIDIQRNNFDEERKRIAAMRELNIIGIENQRSADGELSKTDELAVIKERIRQKTREIREEQERINNATSDELEMEARKLEALAIAERYQLEREQREKEREIREERYATMLSNVEAKAWKDSYLSQAEKIEIAITKQKIAQLKLDEARKRLAMANTEELRKQAKEAGKQAMIELGKATADVRDATQSGGSQTRNVQTAIKGSIEAYQMRIKSLDNVNTELINEAKKQTKTQGEISSKINAINKNELVILGKVE